MRNYNFKDQNSIGKKIFDTLVSVIDFKECDITLETELSNINIDSITFIKIVVALENEFDFEFDDDMLAIIKFPTIKSLITYIESMIK